MKQIEKRDSVLTSKQQIDRLLRPGASYFNLNPFEVSLILAWKHVRRLPHRISYFLNQLALCFSGFQPS